MGGAAAEGRAMRTVLGVATVALALALLALCALAAVWRCAVARLIRRREDAHAADLARMQARLDEAARNGNLKLEKIPK